MLAAIIFLTGVDMLQTSTEEELLDLNKWLPNQILEILPLVRENLCSLSLLGFLMHSYGVNKSKVSLYER